MQSGAIGIIGHKQSVLSLYRSLLRNVRRVKKSCLLQEIAVRPQGSFALNQEVKKYNINPTMYLQYTQTELERAVQVEFRSKRKVELAYLNQLRDRIASGIKLDSILEDLRSNEDHRMALVDLMSIVVEYRRSKILQQQWRAEYLQDPESIDSERKKEMSPLQAKRFDTLKQRQEIRRSKPIPITKLSHSRDKSKRIANEKKQSELNALRVLQRYFKKLQGNHLIPNPSLLPYTPEETRVVDVEHSPLVKKKTLMEAYDWEYVEAIVKPGLAYDINLRHYYEKYKHIVEEKGPYKVHIRTTEAGPVAMPYLELPFPRLAEMKKIALDIKNLLRIYRLLLVWNATQQSMSQVTESRYNDGSFNVKGSKGFRTGAGANADEERVFPRAHYEQWCKWEADWEYAVEVERGNTKVHRADFVNQWIELLDISTKYLEQKFDWYFTHYRELVRNPKSIIYEDQAKYQQIMDEHYDHLLKTYKSFLKDLVNSKLFKHGELVNSEVLGNEKKFEDLVLEEDSRPKGKKTGGIPQLERIGMSMQLGDYLQRHGLKNFQWGYKFDKKFKF